MKEKIRQLETQLAREKMRSSQPLQQSPAHTRVVYGGTGDGYSAQVQPYATRVQHQQVVYPAVTAQQPAFYSPGPAATPTYQYGNWSGPQYSGDLAAVAAGLQTIPAQGPASFLLPQPGTQPPPAPQQSMGRSLYIQQQPQDLLNKDHMLAMYLQIQEQSKPYHHHQPLPLSSYTTPPQPASAQAGYGGGASVGYPNHFVPSTGTPYLMKPY
jgi:hypothetical protein